VNAVAGIDSFRRALRSAITGFWRGETEMFGFVDQMLSALNFGYRWAWRDGAAQFGITMEELTDEERNALQRCINDDISHVMGIASDIARANRDSGGKLTPFLNRAELWVNRYNAVQALAATYAGANRKFEFVLGPTEKHCRSCLGLAGRVYRGDVWRGNNAVPPTHSTECGGWRCQCRLQPTDRPCTPGKFPTGLLAH
jgi:hypothetical protein